MGVKSVLTQVDLASFLSYEVLILKFIRAEKQEYSNYTTIIVVVNLSSEAELRIEVVLYSSLYLYMGLL